MDCESVLDIGCGPSSPLQYCKNVKYSVGVEPFIAYLNESKKKKIHSKYLKNKIEELNFPEKSFDAVIMIEVLEHLPKKLGHEIVQKAQKWVSKKVIITTPNGFIHQRPLDGNKLQEHLSGWTVNDFNKLGFKVRGLSGFKLLRQEVQSLTMGNDITSSIRLRPKYLWFIVASLSQLITFWLPAYSFEFFCVRLTNKKISLCN